MLLISLLLSLTTPKRTFCIEPGLPLSSIMIPEFTRRGWEHHTFNGSCLQHNTMVLSVRVRPNPPADQIVNHMPSEFSITTKEFLYQTLVVQDRAGGVLPSPLSTFVPRTYVLSDPFQRQLFYADFRRGSDGGGDPKSRVNRFLNVSPAQDKQSIDGSDNLWIVKPAFGARGEGISMIVNESVLLEHVEKATPSDRARSRLIVQKYVERQFLLPGERKFDIRQNVLVLSLDPLVYALYDDCSLRVARQPFDADNPDPRSHLTNFGLGGRNKEENGVEDDAEEDVLWSRDRFVEYLRGLGYSPKVWNRRIRPRIARAIKGAMFSWDPSTHRPNSFAIIGFDVILDEDLNVWLLEANTTPNMKLTGKRPKELNTAIALDIVKVLEDGHALSRPQRLAKLYKDKKKQRELFGGWRLDWAAPSPFKSA